MTEQSERSASTTTNNKIHSDSGYGSHKSNTNSQSQRSSGSSKISSKQSSLSSGSGGGGTSASKAEGYTQTPSPTVGGKRHQSGKKNKLKALDRKSSGEKGEVRSQDEMMGMKICGGVMQLSMDHGNANTMLPASSTPQPQGPCLAQASPPLGVRKIQGTQDKALQVAALTHALSCMKKFQDSEIPITEPKVNEDLENCKETTSVQWEEYIPEEFRESLNEDAFTAVVSLDDGVIGYISPSIINILGFPNLDMLLGRSFIDFVHQRDRIAFASHITSGINFPIGEQRHFGKPEEPFYCRLRQYRGLKTFGFGVTDKSVVFHPFKLTMHLKKVDHHSEVGPRVIRKPLGLLVPRGSNDVSMQSGDSYASSFSSSLTPPPVQNLVYLVMRATMIKSAYQYPEEVMKNPARFVTRHSASCHFGHVDPEAIKFLGHLPQDLIDNPVLDFYHPEDMGYLKDVYEEVMQEQGKPFRSKPYRFRVFNGTFAMLETDWSCFVNPWSLRLEFVIGQHRVVKGPLNPNVFMSPQEGQDEMMNIPEEILSDGKEMQNEIRQMLAEIVTKKISDPMRYHSSRRRKELAALMETLLDMAKENSVSKSGSQCSSLSVMERDSAMLGEISPHTLDNSGSNLSSSTPPSYNQLNYRENIDRFFKSQPKTEKSSDSSNKMDAQNQFSESDPNIDDSSGSNIRKSSGSNESGNDQGEETSQWGQMSSLTPELLAKHNEEMQKLMVQDFKESKVKLTPGSHKETRSVDDASDLIKLSRLQRSKRFAHKVASRLKRKSDLPSGSSGLFLQQCAGLKRMGNSSWDGDSQNAAKQPHLMGMDTKSRSVCQSFICSSNGIDSTGINSVSLWPPFSLSISTLGVQSPSYGYCTFPNPNSKGHPVCNPSTITGNGNNLEDSFNGQTSLPLTHQCLPRQVQLLPTGILYQPILSGGYPILMPILLGAPTSSCSRKMCGTSPTVCMASSVPIVSTTGCSGIKMSTGSPKKDMRQNKVKKSENFRKIETLAQKLKECGDLMDKSSGSGTDGIGSGSDEGLTISSSTSKEPPLEGQEKFDKAKQENISNMKLDHSWLGRINISPELSLRYEVPIQDLGEILRKDLQALKIIGKQSAVVNDQLDALYHDLHADGGTTNLYGDDGMISSSSSGGEEQLSETIGDSHKKSKKKMNVSQYSRVAIIHEENAPFPDLLNETCRKAVSLSPASPLGKIDGANEPQAIAVDALIED